MHFSWFQAIALRRTAIHLVKFQQVIESYKDQTGNLPKTITELYLYCSQQKLKCKFHDAFANPIQYLRLGESYYIVRSFGELGEPNNATVGRNLVRGKLPPLPAVAATANSADPAGPGLYPAHFNDGVINDDGSWFARVYRDHGQRLSILILENKTDPDLFMVSREQKIEEFYWVSTNEIVYTQSGATRSPDDIYLWNLESGLTKRLLPCLEGSRATPFLGSSTKAMLSLLGMERQSKKLTVLARVRDYVPLDLDELYAPRNLFTVNVDSQSDAFCSWKPYSGKAVQTAPQRSVAFSGTKEQREYAKFSGEKDYPSTAATKATIQKVQSSGCTSMSPHVLYEILAHQITKNLEYAKTLAAMQSCGSVPTYMYSITDKIRK